MSALRCKMQVESVTQRLGPDRTVVSESLTLRAVYANSEENKTWAKYTPAAQLTIQIDNPAAFGKVQSGAEYFVDISPVATPTS